MVLLSGSAASINVNGGANGTTLTPGVPYGATSGTSGISATNVSLSQIPGVRSGAECTPDLTIGKSHSGNFTRGAIATYAITVSNISLDAASSGVVTVSDTLPAGLTPTAASGTGWSCSIAALDSYLYACGLTGGSEQLPRNQCYGRGGSGSPRVGSQHRRGLRRKRTECNQ